MKPQHDLDAIHFLGELPREILRDRKGPLFVRHDEAPGWWRFILAIGFLFNLRRRWVTVGGTIFYPEWIDSYAYQTTELQELHWINKHLSVVAHEFVHLTQWFRLGAIRFLLLYFVFPLPVFFSGRWWLERDAFLVQIRHFGMTIGEATTAVSGKAYTWCWPKRWILEWFEVHK
jgi:hypothetical protein